jgi:hypothetical protein
MRTGVSVLPGERGCFPGRLRWRWFQRGMNRTVIRASLVLLVVLAFGSSSGAALLCAWSCAALHEVAEASDHHDCEEPAADVVTIGSAAHCGEHAIDANLVAVGALSPASAPVFGSGVLTLQPVVSGQSGPLAVTRRGAGPPSSQRRTILRV